MVQISNEIYLGAAEEAASDLNDYYTKSEVNTALAGKANVATTLAGYGITDGANTALSNLSTDGQMIVDSQNGTISNCVLEIPQNIKLTLENNVLTLASGSVVALTGYNTYTTRTTTANITKDSWASGWYNKTVLLYIGSTGTWFGFKEVSKVGSGSSLPVDNTNFDNFYLTTDYSWYEWENGTWSKKNFSYPLAIVNVDSNGVATFAKDSNGNDMIFNGAGFVGHHAFVYPNVKALISDRFNDDGSLKSISRINNGLRITELYNFQNHGAVFLTNWSTYILANAYDGTVDNIENLPTNGHYCYVKTDNAVSQNNNGTITENVNITPLVFYTYDGTTVTDFTIRQPYQGARSLITDDLYKQIGDVETLLATV